MDFTKIGETHGEQALGGRKPNEKWTYIGAGGAIMETAVKVFAETLSSMVAAKNLQPEKVVIQIAGTSYATYGKPQATLWPILLKAVPGLQGEERVERLGYMETLRKLLASDRLILFGTDDPGYTASKLFTYILAKRPLLVICREESSVARIVRETKAGELITFGEEEVRLGGRIRIRPEWKQAMERWLAMDPVKEPATDWKAFEPYTAKKMTEKLCRFFDERLEAENRKAGKIDDRRWEKGGAAGNRKREAGRELKTDRPKVLLLHPGVQHAPRLAEALEREGLLARFWTGWAKAGFGGGKRNVEIPEEKLRTRRWVEWVALALSRSGIDPETVWHWRNRIFQDLIPESEIEAADVVVGFDTGSWILAQRAKRLGKKFILDQSIGHPAARIPEMAKMGRAEETWEEPYQPRPGRLANWEKVEHELADRIVVGSQFTRNTLIGQGVPAEKIRILPYGVGKEFVEAGERRDGGGKCGKIRFLYLGQLTQRKGLRFLLEAWKGILAGEAEMILMGGGQTWGWKKQAGAEVTFIGQASRDRVLEEMGRSDVLILPSLFEGFGLVILEAMAAALPVITTQNTGGPDVIGKGREGFVVPAGNAEALREKMEWFINHPERAAEMGKAAHRKAKEFTWERYGKAYAEIVREVARF
jgi:starch synthase